jgi:hypothetical protein
MIFWWWMTILICHQPVGSTILESPSFILCRNRTEHILKSPLLWRVTGVSVGAACFSKSTRHTSLSTYWQTEFGCPIGQFHAEMDSIKYYLRNITAHNGCLLPFFFFFFLGFDKKAQYGPNFSSTQLLWLHIVKATVIFENISIFSPVTLIINLLWIHQFIYKFDWLIFKYPNQ